MLTPNGCDALSCITSVNQLKIKSKYLLLVDMGAIGYNYPSTIKRSDFFRVEYQANLPSLPTLTNVPSGATNPLNPP
jgi:hypothetical protein